MPSAVILGSSGAFGVLFARALSAEGWTVTGLDVAAPGGDARAALPTMVCDVLALTPEARAAIAGAEHVIVSLPETVALAAASGVIAAMRPDAIWIDFVAVKSRMVAFLHREAPRGHHRRGLSHRGRHHRPPPGRNRNLTRRPEGAG